MNTLYIQSSAPTRICDTGGWTDTHFAEWGAVFNVAVQPAVHVEIQYVSHSEPLSHVTVQADNFDLTYEVRLKGESTGEHPLLDAVIRSITLPSTGSLLVRIFSDAPAGASMGTSAAVAVALVGGLDVLTEGRMTPCEVAYFAHAVETKRLGLESGIQDQLASVYGGANYIEITSFPEAKVNRLSVSEAHGKDFQSRLLVAYIGMPHNSSDVHQNVIKKLGVDPSRDERLNELRRIANKSAHMFLDANWEGLGDCFNQNTAVQRKLHEKLVCESFEHIIQLASDLDVLGCKVNGAGGDGGSVAVLLQDSTQWQKLADRIVEGGYVVVPVQYSTQGLEIQTSSAPFLSKG